MRDPNAKSEEGSVSFIILVLILMSAVACHKKMMAAPPPPPPPSLIGEDNNLQESLFKGDQAVLSNQDINFSETIAKAETDAQGKAPLKVADAVVAFLHDQSK